MFIISPFVSGIYGGMRSAMQLRALTGEIGCISMCVYYLPFCFRNLWWYEKCHAAESVDGGDRMYQYVCLLSPLLFQESMVV